MNIGPYLKQLRQDKGYTLNDVAAMVEMSASFLSQIENMKLSPSLDSLEKLLSFYAVNLSDFFRQVEQRRVIIVRSEETRTFDVSGGGIRLTLLASKLQNNSLETFIVKFLKNNASIDTAVLPKEINGERIIYILKGSLLISLDNGTGVTLTEGDSVNYKSDVPCSIIANGEHAELLISGMPPLIIADYNNQ
ncbi:MAG TPA: helix-turn-helix domain-containing protein [Spirochaetota bacterium]|nr:helix-turn-helix domain-containing protein [Spirochaetota bacterium]HQO40717.1 helix-turn-helix domain-containing protein [Spirochaetota bacterium]